MNTSTWLFVVGGGGGGRFAGNKVPHTADGMGTPGGTYSSSTTAASVLKGINGKIAGDAGGGKYM
jgi:hypothetical protein